MHETWVTSDLHFGHRKVAATRFGYSEVPAFWTDFETRRHDEILIHKWRSVVRPWDTVIVAGDISSGSSAGQRHALDILAGLPGEKILVPGNHDGPHPYFRDAHKWHREYSEVFKSIQFAVRRRVALDEGHTNVLIHHFPYRGDHSAEDRFTQWRLPDEGTVIVHGHTHSKDIFSRGKIRGRLSEGVWSTTPGTLQIHIGVDAWDGLPVNLKTIADYVRREVERQHADD